MKKYVLSVFNLFLFFACLLFAGCNSFINGENIKKDLEKKIAYANAPVYTIKINSDFGNIAPLGNINMKVGDPIDLQFKLSNDYLFSGFKVYNSETNDVLSDCFDFSEIKSYFSSETQNTTYDCRATLLKGFPNILLKTDVNKKPAVESSTPDYSTSGVRCDSTIEITFATPVKAEDFNSFKNILITCGEKILAGENAEIQYFNTPVLSSDKKTLSIYTNKDQYLFEKTESKQYKELTVTLNLKNLKDEKEIYFEDNYSLNYRINSNRDEIPPEQIKIELKNNYTENILSSKDFDNWNDDDFESNHVNTFHIKASAIDTDSEISKLVLIQKLLKNNIGIDVPSKEYSSTFMFGKADENFCSTLETDFIFTNEYADGLLKLDFYIYDKSGNKSDAITYYVIKDTFCSNTNINIRNEIYTINENSPANFHDDWVDWAEFESWETWDESNWVSQFDSNTQNYFFKSKNTEDYEIVHWKNTLADNWYLNKTSNNFTYEAYYGKDENNLKIADILPNGKSAKIKFCEDVDTLFRIYAIDECGVRSSPYDVYFPRMPNEPVILYDKSKGLYNITPEIIADNNFESPYYIRYMSVTDSNDSISNYAYVSLDENSKLYFQFIYSKKDNSGERLCGPVREFSSFPLRDKIINGFKIPDYEYSFVSAGVNTGKFKLNIKINDTSGNPIGTRFAVGIKDSWDNVKYYSMIPNEYVENKGIYSLNIDSGIFDPKFYIECVFDGTKYVSSEISLIYPCTNKAPKINCNKLDFEGVNFYGNLLKMGSFVFSNSITSPHSYRYFYTPYLDGYEGNYDIHSKEQIYNFPSRDFYTDDIYGYTLYTYIPVYGLDDGKYLIYVKASENENDYDDETVNWGIGSIGAITIKTIPKLTYAKYNYDASSLWRQISLSYDYSLNPDSEYTAKYISADGDAYFYYTGITDENKTSFYLSSYNNLRGLNTSSNPSYDFIKVFVDAKTPNYNYMKDGNQAWSAPTYLYTGEVKDSYKLSYLMDDGNKILIMTDQPCFVHTLASMTDFGDNIDEWERRGFQIDYSECEYEKSIKTTQNYKQDTSMLVAGDYYVTIAYFADGSYSMSKVRQK